jgi:hypothetical protein
LYTKFNGCVVKCDICSEIEFDFSSSEPKIYSENTNKESSPYYRRAIDANSELNTNYEHLCHNCYSNKIWDHVYNKVIDKCDILCKYCNEAIDVEIKLINLISIKCECHSVIGNISQLDELIERFKKLSYDDEES